MDALGSIGFFAADNSAARSPLLMNNLLKFHHSFFPPSRSLEKPRCCLAVVLKSSFLRNFSRGICIRDEMAKVVAKHRDFMEIVSPSKEETELCSFNGRRNESHEQCIRLKVVRNVVVKEASDICEVAACKSRIGWNTCIIKWHEPTFISSK